MGRSGNSKKRVSSSATQTRTKKILSQEEIAALNNIPESFLSQLDKDAFDYLDFLEDDSFDGIPGYYNEGGGSWFFFLT